MPLHLRSYAGPIICSDEYAVFLTPNTMLERHRMYAMLLDAPGRSGLLLMLTCCLYAQSPASRLWAGCYTQEQMLRS